MKSTYDKFPSISIDNGMIIQGWENIISTIEKKINNKCKTITIECYSGVYYEELKSHFKKIKNALFIDTLQLFKTEKSIKSMTKPFITNDILFGYYTNLSIENYFNKEKVKNERKKIDKTKGTVIIFGYGAQYIKKGDLVIYADMPRWEIQQRMRKKEVTGLGVNNKNEEFSLQYKRGLFNDWKVLDRHKKQIYEVVDFWIDSVSKENPKMIDKSTFFEGMEKASKSPFRVVPFFDPAPWGGQWMKAVFDLDNNISNFGWCFDCVPEENSLLLKVNDVLFEMPSINLVYLKSKDLLGEPVEARFGKEFPIRFDFLDTMEGGNLSLQVHPTFEFAHENFGLTYTQDESYYIVDAKEDSCVYLGVKTGTNKNSMLEELKKANACSGVDFAAEKYVNKIPAKKHDHFLIPAGSIHCSGKNTVVLEISTTPNLFTFKLWDWQRLGLDGKPRPINIERGEKVIQWNRNSEYVENELTNKFEIIDQGDGWIEEKTGLHKTQFIETRRHTFSKPVLHSTHESVNVLNLVEGEEIVIESLNGEFEPLIIHYAETFIIPACINQYIIKPHGNSSNNKCITIKAFVRH